MVLYFLACFSFLTFFLPVITKEISLRTFLAGGLISLMILIGLVLFLYYSSALKSREQMIRRICVAQQEYTEMNTEPHNFSRICVALTAL